MRYVVTGAAGMLGRALRTRLLDDGHDVVGLDLSDRDVEGRPVAVADLGRCGPGRDGVLREALSGADGVFHTAAVHGFRDAEPQAYFDANVVGAWNLFRVVADTGVPRVVHSSTVGVYGEAPHIEVAGDTPRGARSEVYNVTKMMSEHVAELAAAADSGPAVVALRYGGFAELIEATFDGLPGAWVDSGALVRLDDVVTANVQAMERLPLPRAAYVVIPTGGRDDTPYKVDASTTEADLGMRFTATFDDYATTPQELS